MPPHSASASRPARRAVGRWRGPPLGWKRTPPATGTRRPLAPSRTARHGAARGENCRWGRCYRHRLRVTASPRHRHRRRHRHRHRHRHVRGRHRPPDPPPRPLCHSSSSRRRLPPRDRRHLGAGTPPPARCVPPGAPTNDRSTRAGSGPRALIPPPPPPPWRSRRGEGGTCAGA